MIVLIFTLILIGVALYAVGLIPMDARILQLIRIVAIIFAVLLVVQAFGILDLGLSTPRGHLP